MNGDDLRRHRLQDRRANTGFQQSPFLEHGPKHRIMLQPKVILQEFKGNMAIAEVIGSLE